MWMPNGNGLSLILRAAESQLELLTHGGYFGDIVEERTIPETGAHAGWLRCVVGNSRRRSATVHVKEIPFLKYGHQLFHKRRIGSGLRALMIVDTHRVRNTLHHLFEKHGNIAGRHARMEFLRFGHFVSDG